MSWVWPEGQHEVFRRPKFACGVCEMYRVLSQEGRKDFDEGTSLLKFLLLQEEGQISRKKRNQARRVKTMIVSPTTCSMMTTTTIVITTYSAFRSGNRSGTTFVDCPNIVSLRNVFATECCHIRAVSARCYAMRMIERNMRACIAHCKVKS